MNHPEEGLFETAIYVDDSALTTDSQNELEEKMQLWKKALANNERPVAEHVEDEVYQLRDYREGGRIQLPQK